MIKTVVNTLLLSNPDVEHLLRRICPTLFPQKLTETAADGIHIAIWISIENDLVLSAACLPTVPPFFRACKAFVSTHVRTSSRSVNRTSFMNIDTPHRAIRRTDTMVVELVRNQEFPGSWAVKRGNESFVSELLGEDFRW